MKNSVKILCLATSIITLMSQTAFASEMMQLYGKTNSDSTQVSVLVLDSSVTDRTNITKNQIKYIDQSDVENGRFSITLPFFDADEYSIHSNLDFITKDEDEKITVYVSASGDDSNSGFSADKPFQTLEAAYAEIEMIDEIVLMDDTTYVEAPYHDGMLKIKGNTATVKLTLPSEVSLNGALTIDNVILSGAAKIYANGYKFKVTETVSSDAGNGDAAVPKSLTVYGGKKDTPMTGDTDLELLGGKYYRIYGGGAKITSGTTATVTGNTSIILGGNANSGDGINDQDKSTVSGCYVYGGGYDAAVNGETKITIKDNAVSRYLIGAGFGTYGSTPKTNIYITGGKVMNVYGGSTNLELKNCDTHITMTGGLVEAIFGGSEGKAMTGNTYITLLGGDVSRRVYSGCYNNYELFSGWVTNNFVTGTTNLAVSPDVKLATKTGLASGNQSDMGIYAGSRDNKNHAEEESRLIFLNDSYNTHSAKIGASGFPSDSYEDYIIKATENGMVKGTNTSKTITITPDNGYFASINNTAYSTCEFTLSSPTTDVAFKGNFFINDVTAIKGENTANGTADINANNTTATEPSPQFYICVYEADSNTLIDCAISDATTGQKTFSLDCQFDEGKRYIVKAMMWNAELKPLTAVYCIELK